MTTGTTTLCLDEMFLLGANHINSLLDQDGRTYFNVFLTEPAEAVTDWPDFVDLPARYWEAALMIEEAIGQSGPAQSHVRDWLLSHFEKDGLAYRPEGPISTHSAEMFDQSRLLYCLVSALMHDPGNEEVRARLEKLIQALIRAATFVDDYAYIEEISLYFGGTLIRPLVQAGLIYRNEEWIEHAGKLARGVFNHSNLISSDGKFKGHVHGALSAIAGTLSYSIIKEDAQLKERALMGFRYVVSISTDFGFVPELAQRNDDMIACETCTLMDYMDVALLIARHIDDSYWNLIEKAARNHLWESQIRDTSWLTIDSEASDDKFIIRRNLGKRLLGAFAGWSAPHCLLAYHEHHGAGWLRKDDKKALYLNKVRALQNCCAGGGIRAVFQVWSNIVTRDKDVVSVNLSLDRSSEDVDVVSFLPFEGRVQIRIKRACILRWRFPIDVQPESISIWADETKKVVPWTQNGAFLDFGWQETKAELIIQFPTQSKTEALVIGNEGCQQYKFDVDWVGDTVTAINPDPQNAKTGFTRVMDCTIPTSYGDKGIGPIYQRKEWANPVHVPSPFPVAENRICRIDWYGLKASS